MQDAVQELSKWMIEMKARKEGRKIKTTNLKNFKTQSKSRTF